MNELSRSFSQSGSGAGLVAITGAAGLVGGNLARALLAEGQPVRALVHADRRALAGLPAGLPVEVVEADLTDLPSLRRAFEGVALVYHLAAQISLRLDNWEQVAAVNVHGTRNVVEACLQCKVRRLVHFSSVHALQQEPLDQPLDEQRPRVATSAVPPYDRSKAAGEGEVQRGMQRGLEAVILNPSAIVGPHDYRPSYFGQALIALAQGRLPALVPGGYDWVDVRDVVAGAMQAGRRAPAGANYILSGHWHAVRQVAGMIAALTGVPAPRLVVPMRLAYLAAPLMSRLARLNGAEPLYTRASLAALQSNRQVSHARAAAELGYRPRPFAETLADTLAWFAAHGYLPGGTLPGGGQN